MLQPGTCDDTIASPIPATFQTYKTYGRNNDKFVNFMAARGIFAKSGRIH
jgi:hypothetical protein